ncbi:MAG TPA: formate dehydrogenase accessory protein FdhE [Candidatus Saccharimonadales bacterium]|nr:formate dehydrogenase accessory protein FdhE [Candidatus Saccharimonadales bacterium]
MTSPQSVVRVYDARIKRAQLLTTRLAFAAQILSFYQSVASFQKNLSTHFASTRKSQPRSFPELARRDTLDLSNALPHVRSFLDMVEQTGPKRLADSAKQLSSSKAEVWLDALNSYWQTGGHRNPSADAIEQFFLRAILQPCAEVVASEFPAREITETPKLCPMCGSQPLLGVLRPEGDGGKRFLLCSFCSHEWSFRRIFCPSCGEDTEAKLPVYVAEQFPHIRVEACETCSTFLRTIDLTKDGHAVPLVDDLAALPLSLWAHEHNFSALQSNLLGT